MPFSLTNEQRKRLVNSGWQTAANRAKAENFIHSSQNIIKHWLAIALEGQSKAPDRRNSASKIKKAAQKLRHTLNISPADVNETIAAEMDVRLFLPRDYPEYIEAANYLRRATGKEYTNLYQMADILDCWLSLLSEAAGEVAAIKSASGENKGREKWLVFNLAASYEFHFGELPSPENDSCFRIFCAELSKILGYELGACIVREVLKERGQNRQLSTKKASKA